MQVDSGQRKEPLRRLRHKLTQDGANLVVSMFLHLPYAYSIPLLAISGTLHYLLSESIFLVRTEAWQDSNRRPESDSSEVYCVSFANWNVG